MRRSKDARQQHQRQRTTASMPMLGMRAHHAALGLDEGAQDEPVAVLYQIMVRYVTHANCAFQFEHNSRGTRSKINSIKFTSISSFVSAHCPGTYGECSNHAMSDIVE